MTTVTFNKAFSVYVVSRATVWIVGSLFVNGDAWRIGTQGHYNQIEQTIALGLTLLYCGAPILSYLSNGLRSGVYKRHFIDRIENSGAVSLAYTAAFIILTYVPITTGNRIHELVQILIEMASVYISGIVAVKILRHNFKGSDEIIGKVIHGDYKEKIGSDGRDFIDVDYIIRA